MTLMVCVYAVHPETGKWEDIPQDTGQGGEGDRTLAGFESCRATLWGSKIVRSLGCRLPSSLASDNLYVSGEDLALLAECRNIQGHLGDISARTRFTEDYIAFRTGNILEAVRMAEAIEHGMVVIW